MTDASEKHALLSRRTILRAGVLAAGIGVVGRLLHLGSAAVGRKLLDAHELELIEALGELMFPEGNAIGPSWRDVKLGERVDEVLAEVIDPMAAEGFRYLLRGLDYACVMSQGSRFCEAEPADRDALMSAWALEFPTNLAHSAVKSVLSMAYFNHPKVLEAVGFVSRCHLVRA